MRGEDPGEWVCGNNRRSRSRLVGRGVIRTRSALARASEAKCLDALAVLRSLHAAFRDCFQVVKRQALEIYCATSAPARSVLLLEGGFRPGDRRPGRSRVYLLGIFTLRAQGRSAASMFASSSEPVWVGRLV